MILFKHGMQKRAEKFWRWFESNEAKLFEFEKNQEAVFDELQDALVSVNQDLCFEFSGVRDEKREFVISAGGIKGSFPAVLTLKQTAPALPRFDVVAFRQPHPGFSVSIDDINIEERDVFVSTEPDGSKLGVLVLMKGVEAASPEKKQALQNIMYLFLDGTLGEYDVATRLSWIELADLNAHSHLPMMTIDKLPEVLKQHIARH